MHRLLYISTARGPITPQMIESILRVSRRNNAADGVTGLLVTGGKRFLQVLEGPREIIAKTFERISQDTRHFAVVRLASQPLSERAFPQWQMGHVAGGDGASVATMAAAIDDPVLRAYFAGFAELHAAA